MLAAVGDEARVLGVLGAEQLLGQRGVIAAATLAIQRNSSSRAIPPASNLYYA